MKTFLILARKKGKKKTEGCGHVARERHHMSTGCAGEFLIDK